MKRAKAFRWRKVVLLNDGSLKTGHPIYGMIGLLWAGGEVFSKRPVWMSALKGEH